VPGFLQGATGQRRRAVFDDLQPKLTLTYEASDNVTLYGGYSRGFRSGGFNQSGVGAVAAANGFVGVSDIFKDETASTFEAGIKTRLLDRKLTLNAAAYSTLKGVEGRTALHIYFVYAALILERPEGYNFLPELAETDLCDISIETA
jgi:outer membrane receptor protein involved in Fe transport